MVTGDVRALSPEQFAAAKKTMQDIVAASLPQTSATLAFDDGYPPLAPTPGNERLLALYSRASLDVGTGPVVAVDPDKAGAADVSFVAGHAGMILDGVGLMGSGGHTVNETADLRTLPSMAKRMAVLLARLRRQALEPGPSRSRRGERPRARAAVRAAGRARRQCPSGVAPDRPCAWAFWRARGEWEPWSRSRGNTVALDCVLEAEAPPRPRVDLLLAVPRPKVMRRLWAQLAALGVSRIILTNAERVERPYFDTHVLTPECYRPLLIEGLQQARDTRLPLVSIHRRFKVLVEDELDALSGRRSGSSPTRARRPAGEAVRGGPRGAETTRACCSPSGPRAAGTRSSCVCSKRTDSRASAWGLARCAPTPRAWRCWPSCTTRWRESAVGRRIASSRHGRHEPVSRRGYEGCSNG